MATTSDAYRQYVQERINALTDIFTRASVGDFSKDVELPNHDDAFTELYAGVQNMLDVIREKIAAFEASNAALKERVQDLRELTQSLWAQQARDEAILQGIGEGLVVTDAHSRIIMVNGAFERLIGWSARDAVGHSLFEVITAEGEDGHLIPIAARAATLVLRSGKKVETRVDRPQQYYRRYDGTRFPVARTVTPIIINGQVSGVINVFRNVTSELELERARDEFVSLASHELRTPLTAIRWSVDMLQTMQASLTLDQRKYLDAVARTSEEMIDLVDTLLNVSRIELGRLVIDPVPTRIEELVAAAVRGLTPQFTAKRLGFHRNIDPALPTISLDPQMTRLAIQNLLTNALKYTPTGGAVTLSVTREGTDLAIRIADTGVGIPDAAKAKVFTKLFRADNIKTQHARGTGLGLYITKAIVEQSGGTISFTSQEGHGTTFTIRLPFAGVPRRTGTTRIPT